MLSLDSIYPPAQSCPLSFLRCVCPSRSLRYAWSCERSFPPADQSLPCPDHSWCRRTSLLAPIYRSTTWCWSSIHLRCYSAPSDHVEFDRVERQSWLESMNNWTFLALANESDDLLSCCFAWCNAGVISFFFSSSFTWSSNRLPWKMIAEIRAAISLGVKWSIRFW